MAVISRDWDIRIYRLNGGVWQRFAFAVDQVTTIEYEVLERGGYGVGKIDMQTPWEGPRLYGLERCDIFRNLPGSGWTLVYRGMVRIPEMRVDVPELRSLSLFGVMETANSWLVTQRYAFASAANNQVDFSVVAQSLAASVLLPQWPALVLDIQQIGVSIGTFDAVDKGFTAAMNGLCDRSPGSAIWGFDAVLQGGVWMDRFYLRPRASTTKYKFPLGKNVKAFTYPADAGAVINRLHIKGGPAPQPNLIGNGGFEHPASPDETNGNLLQDYGFEASTYNYTHNIIGIVTGGAGGNIYWTLAADASLKDTVHPGPGGTSAVPRDGRWWVALDQNGETVSQTVQIDRAYPVELVAWVRRGIPATTASWNMYADGLNASGTLVKRVMLYAGMTEVYNPATDIGPSVYSRRMMQADFSGVDSVGVTQVTYTVIGGSGSNANDGIFVDGCGLWYRDRPVQQHWVSQPVTCPVSEVNWVQSVATAGDNTAALSGGYCIKVSCQPGGGGYTEVRTAPWARVKLKAKAAYYVYAAVRTTAGSSFSVTIGTNLYDGNGLKQLVIESVTYTGGTDGAWYELSQQISFSPADLDAEVFIRVHSSVPTYIDNVMLIEGTPLTDYMHQASASFNTVAYPVLNFWEGDNYERVIDVTDPLLSTALTSAAASSIGTYGTREMVLDEPGVVDQATAVALATGIFNDKAIPPVHARVTLDAYTGIVGLDGLVEIVQLANAPAALAPSVVRTRITETISVEIDLDNERPSLVLLLNNARTARVTAVAKQNRGSTPYNSGGSTVGGGAQDANVVHLTGTETISGAKIFAPASGTTPILGMAAPSQTVDDMLRLYKADGTLGMRVAADGTIYVNGVAVSGGGADVVLALNNLLGWR